MARRPLARFVLLRERLMDLAWISLSALLVVIGLSCTTRINPGLLAIAFAWGIALYVAPAYGVRLTLKSLAAGFPTELFLTLVGVTLLFTLAYENGTLERVTRAAVGLCRGNVGFIGLAFFALAFGFSTIGIGGIAASALLARMAMPIAERAGISAFLMTILVSHGALAGALSPFAPTGQIAKERMELIQLPNHEWQLFWHNCLANCAVALGGYFLFGGGKLFARTYVNQSDGNEPARFEGRHILTAGIVAGLLLCVVALEVDIGMGAFAASGILILCRAGDEIEAFRKMPWGVIIMVCGVSVLVAVVHQTGGTDAFKRLIRTVSTRETVTGVMGFVTGVVSVYSSTSGVVLPAFLPLADDVGGDPWAVASAIVISGHLVDSSPLSTIGALCIACAPLKEDRRLLFTKVLAWGLSMAVVGAAISYVFFGLLASAASAAP